MTRVIPLSGFSSAPGHAHPALQIRLNESVCYRVIFLMPVLIKELSRAMRRLRSSPALFAAATISLAFGVGPNLTAFSMMRELVLDDLSADHPDRLARV